MNTKYSLGATSPGKFIDFLFKKFVTGTSRKYPMADFFQMVS
jgi:hypothetical protein